MVIGILAHVDAGKTTLSEALLYTTGKIRSLGRVDHKDAYLDTDAMEKERGITIFSKQARIVVNEKEITLLDTPGHVDFSAEMERTLQVLDYAMLVISGTDGVQGHTRTLWRLLKHYQVPTFLFINKMDMDGTDKEKLKQELKTELSEGCVDFSDSNCLEEHTVKETKEKDFREELAVCSEALLNEYLETGSLSDNAIQQEIRNRNVFPCFYGSALKLEGVEELIAGIGRFTAPKTYGNEFSARVYKIGRDDRGARLTYLKITGGDVRSRETIEYVNREGEPVTEKIDQLRKYSGEKYETVEQAKAGEIVAVTGLSQTMPGQGLGFEKDSNEAVLEPVLNYKLILPKDVNPAEFLKNMRILEEEDPKLSVVWMEEAKEIHV